MKYLRLYNSHSEYLDPDYVPNVTYCENNEVHAIELWSNPECTKRPDKEYISRIYCLLNKDFYEAYTYGDVRVVPCIVEGDPNTIDITYDWNVDVAGIIYDENKQYIPAGVYELNYHGNPNLLPELNVDSFSFGEIIETSDKHLHYITNLAHEIEIWANPECTKRPSGETGEVYVLFNKTFSTDYEVRDKSDGLIFFIQFSEYDDLTYIYYKDFDNDIDGVLPIEAGTVIKLEHYETRDVTNYTFSFGEKIVD